MLASLLLVASALVAQPSAQAPDTAQSPDAAQAAQDPAAPKRYYALLRTCVSRDLTGDKLTFFGLGRSTTGGKQVGGVLYCLRLDLGTEALELVWSTACPPPVHSHSLHYAPALGELPGSLAMQGFGGGYLLFDAASGERMAHTPQERLLDHASVPGIGHVTLSAPKGRLQLRVTAPEAGVSPEVFVTPLEHVSAATVVQTAAGLRFMASTAVAVGERSKEWGHKPVQKTILSCALQEDGELISSELWKGAVSEVGVRAFIVCEGQRFAASLLEEGSNSLVVTGELEADGRALMDGLQVFKEQDPWARKGSTKFPSFGGGVALFDGQIVISRPGDPEIPLLRGYSLTDGATQWEIKGHLGQQPGTRISPLGRGRLMVSCGGLGTALANKTGELLVYQSVPGEAPRLLATVRESQVHELLQSR